MQGKNSISPSVVRALVASAALLAGASTAPLRAQTSVQPDRYKETAFAVVRLSSGGANSGISFPHPLTSEDARKVRIIFDLQRKGDFQNAIIKTAKINNNLLLGDILADRYLNPKYLPDAGELRSWLKNFSSYVDAQAIAKRLTTIDPKSTNPIIHPALVLGKETARINLPMDEEADPITTTFKRNILLDRTIYERAKQGLNGAKSALALIKATPGMTDLYAAQLQAEIAMQLFSIGENEFALQIAQKAFSLSQGRIGLAGYTAGLIAWKMQKNDLAFYLFEKAAQSDLTSPSIRAACFFWAARIEQKVGDMQAYNLWLRRAAASPRTFYGILANRILNEATSLPEAKLSPLSFSSSDEASVSNNLVLSQIDVDIIADTALGKRFFALIQVDEKERAETILRQLWMEYQHDTALHRSIQLVAKAVKMDGLSDQLTSILDQTNDVMKTAHPLPTPHLSPLHGYKINPALVYAMIRLESNFNAHAVSGKGARGLMQIMPVTAKYIVDQTKNISLSHPTQLQNEALNLEIGQLYLLHLAELASHQGQTDLPKGGNLIHMLASYNAGPANLAHWLDQYNNEDPLLFIESIPLQETRNYLHRAFAYLWIYSEKLDLPIPSLDALAKNQWPAFAEEEKLAKSTTIH